jgi:hypothetical protein
VPAFIATVRERVSVPLQLEWRLWGFAGGDDAFDAQAPAPQPHPATRSVR